MPNICPKCLKDDKVQKVNSLFPVRDGSTNIGFAHQNKSSEYEVAEKTLVEKLTPPPSPNNPGSGWAYWGLLCTAGGMIASIGSCALTAILTGGMGESLAFICGFLGGIIGIAAGGIYADTTHRKKANLYKQQLEAWEIWENLFYCSRDDILFNPLTGESESSGDFIKLIRNDKP